MIKLKSDQDENYVCLNTSIEAFLTNKQFVLQRLSKIHIHLMISFLTVREIDANVHETKEYVNFSIYLSSKEDSKRMTKIHKEMHLVESLKVNMLIGNDILESKDIIIDIQERKATISSCQNLITDVKIHQRGPFVRRNVISQFASLIPPGSYAKIPYKIKGTRKIPNSMHKVHSGSNQMRVSIDARSLEAEYFRNHLTHYLFQRKDS